MTEPLSREERDRHLMHWPSTCGRWEATVQQAEARAERLREALEEAHVHAFDKTEPLVFSIFDIQDVLAAALRADDEARGRA